MGYTHYFAYDPKADEFTSAWPQIVSDARLIVEHVQSGLHIPLAGGMGEGAPQLNERWIWLNGPNRGDLGHETLLIDAVPWKAWDEQERLGHSAWAEAERANFESRGFIASFCKTARKPYDIAVTSILLRAAHLAPNAVVISSDGDWRSEWQYGAGHWEPGCEQSSSPASLVNELFGQVETPDASPLVLNVWDGPPCARPEADDVQ